MKVLVTGATGFLGSHLCRRLVAAGHDVRIPCRPTSDFKSLEGLPLERIVGDVTEPVTVGQAVRDQEYVIHAAANLSYWERNEAWQMRVNAGGTRHLAQACRAAGARQLHCRSRYSGGPPASS